MCQFGHAVRRQAGKRSKSVLFSVIGKKWQHNLHNNEMGKSDLNHTNEKGALGKQKKPLSLHNAQSCRGPKCLLNDTTEGGLGDSLSLLVTLKGTSRRSRQLT